VPRRRADPDSGAAQVVQRTLNELQPAIREHQARCDRYDRAYRIWRSPDDPSERRGRPDWKPLLKVKYGMQVVDQAMVAIVQGVPKPRCTPRNSASVGAAMAMEKTLSYFGDQAHLAEVQPIVAQQALVYSVSPCKQRWLYKEIDQRMLVPARDPSSGEPIWDVPSEQQQKIVECDRPDIQPWDVYDCFWDPAATSPDTASFIVLRCWPTKDDLLGNAYNADTGVGMYRNLERLFSLGSGGERPAKAQNEVLGKTLSYEGHFEVWEVWRDHRLTVIGNKQVLLYDGPKPYWMPGKPVTISTTRPDFFGIEGISETELVDHIQQTLHSEDNLRLENLRFTVQRGATVRETVPNMDELVMQPHFMWRVTDHDDVDFKNQPPLPPEAYQEHETLLSLLQYVTGITPYVTGASSAAGVDQSTATGVSVLAGAAGKLLAFKAQLIAQRTYQRMWEQWADLTRQFLRSPREIHIDDRDPTSGQPVGWVSVGPQDIFGDYDVRIEAAEESLNKQQKRADVVALLNAFAPYAAAGLVDIKPLLVLAAESFNFPAPQALFPAQPPQQLAAPNGNGQQVASGAPPLTLTNGAMAPQPFQAVMRGRAGG
jgi:hypothetical protein